MKIKHRLITISMLLGMLWSALISAQPYCNEWIQYNQLYAKYKVARNAWYRIPFTALQNAGFPAESAGFQVFFKGEQIPLWVSTNGDMTENDYLLFYATANDSSFDTQLFSNPDWQASTLKSLFSDSISYFITWNNLAPNKRFNLAANDLSSPPAPEPFFMHKEQKAFKNIFNPGNPIRMGANINLPFYEEGEGWTGQEISGSSPNGLNTTLPTPHLYMGADAPLPLFESVIVGRSNDFSAVPDHPFTIKIGGMTYVHDNFEEYGIKRIQCLVLPSHIGQLNTEVKYTAQLSGLVVINKISVVEATFNYPRLFDADSLSVFNFILPDHSARYIEIAHFNGGTAPILADLSNGHMLLPIPEGNHYNIMLPQVPEGTGQRQLLLFNTDEVCPYNCQSPDCTPANCVIFEVDNLTAFTFTDYTQTDRQGNYIIISHPFLQQGDTNRVAQYAAYRATPQGGAHIPQVVNIEELYDQFAYGISKHPLAIRHFVNFAIDHWTIVPQYVYLLGKGISYESVTNNPIAYPLCLVPTFGHHPSDVLLVSRNSENWLPQLPVGRLSAKNPDEVRWFFEKIVDYETPKPCTWNDRLWTKKLFAVASVDSYAERDSLLPIIQKHIAVLDSSSFNFLPTEVYSQATYSIVPQNEFNESYNQGGLLFNYAGESNNAGAIHFDFNSPETYDNASKLPFFLANAGFVGDAFSFGTSNTSFLEKYVLPQNKGAIGGLAGVNFEAITFTAPFMKHLLSGLFHWQSNQPFGISLHQTRLAKMIPQPQSLNDFAFNIANLSLHYEGDPALQLAGRYTNPEFTLLNIQENPDVQAINPVTLQLYPIADTITLQTDMLMLQIGVGNLGSQFSQALPLLVQQTNSAGTVVKTDTLYLSISEVENQHTITLPIFTVATPDTLQISLELNPDEVILEDCYNNNSTTLTIIAPACIASAATTNLNSGYCANAAPVVLEAIPQGGTFYINGIAQNVYNPADYANENEVSITYQYTDDNGCSAETTQVVVQYPLPQLSMPDTLQINSLQLPYLLQSGYDQPGTVFNWNTGATTADISINEAGVYTLNLTDANGCMAEAGVVVAVADCNQAVLPTITNLNSDYCANASPVVLEATPQGGVFYINGIAQNVYHPADYADENEVSITYQYTDDNGCPAETTQVVVQYPLPQLSLPDTLQINSLQLPYLLQSGYDQPGAVFNWSTGATTADISITEAGVYTLNLTDANGCMAEVGVVVAVADCNQAILPSINNLNSGYCANVESVVLEATPPGGVFYINGIAQNVYNPAEYTDETEVSITYQYTDDNGCPAETTQVVVQYPLPQLSLPDTLQINSVQLPYLLQSGFDQPGAVFNWSTGATTADIFITEAGVYTLNLTDANGCSISASVTVEVSVSTSPHQAPTLRIYPNPVSQTLHIIGILQTASANLYNNMGQLAFSQELLPNMVNTMPTEQLATGVYYLQISLLNGVVVGQKVVKW